MPFNMGAGYNLGGIGAGQNQFACPIDLKDLQDKIMNGSITPNMVISFGDEIKSGQEITNIGNVVYLYAMHSFFETPTLGFRAQNLHRSGATKASPVWGVIPRNVVGVSLMKQLHTQSIKSITIMSLSYTNSSSSPIITEIRTFGSCFVIYLDPWTYGHFIVFAFTFVTLTWELKDFKQRNEDGSQCNLAGQRSYTFEFDKATGMLGD